MKREPRKPRSSKLRDTADAERHEPAVTSWYSVRMLSLSRTAHSLPL